MGRSLAPLAENDWPATLICETCTAVESWFTSETGVLAVWPIVTPPKVTVFGVA